MLTEEQLPKPAPVLQWLWVLPCVGVLCALVWAQQELIVISGAIDLESLPVYAVALTAVVCWLLESLSNNWESVFVAFLWEGIQALVVALGALLAGATIANGGDEILLAVLIAALTTALIDAVWRKCRAWVAQARNT